MVEEKSKVDVHTNLDSETDEEPPGLISNIEEHISDSSDDEDDPDCANGSEDETSEEEFPHQPAEAAPAPTSGKRSSAHMDTTPKVVKRRKNRRNTSHASKLECLDVQEIKECLETKGCSCGADCLKKLKTHGVRAVRAIEKLRLQRFQGKFSGDMENVHHHFSHPRGEINS